MDKDTVSLYCVSVGVHDGLYELFFDFKEEDDMEKVSTVTNIPIVNRNASLLMITTNSKENLPETDCWYNVPLNHLSKLKEHIVYTDNHLLLFQLK